MAKKAIASKQEPPAKGSDRETIELFTQIAVLLADRDPYQVNRVLVALQTLYPSKLTVGPSNGVRELT